MSLLTMICVLRGHHWQTTKRSDGSREMVCGCCGLTERDRSAQLARALPAIADWSPKRATAAEWATTAYLGTWRVEEVGPVIVGERYPTDAEILADRERRVQAMHARVFGRVLGGRFQ